MQNNGLLAGMTKGPMTQPMRGVAPEANYAGQPNATPEEQAQYDQFMDNAFTMIYQPEVMSGLLGRMMASGNPVEGLASATVKVVSRLEESARKKGVKIDPAVLVHGGADVMGELANAAKMAGLHEFTDEDIENASYVAMDEYGTQAMQAGTLDKEAVARDFETMQAADRAGRIDEVFPGLSQKAREIEARKQGGGKNG